MWRRLLVLAAVAAGVALGVLVALKSPRVAHNIAQRLERFASTRGVELRIGALRLEVFPPGVAVEELVAATPDGDLDLHLRRGHVALRPWPSTSGALVLESLRVEGLAGRVQLDRLAGGGGGAAALPIDLADAYVEDVALELGWGAQRLGMRGARIELAPGDGGKRFVVDLGDAAWSAGESAQPVALRLAGALRGSIDRPERLEISAAALRTAGLQLDAEGSLDFAAAVPILDAEVSGAARLTALQGFVPAAPALGGEAVVQLEAKGAVLAPTVRADAVVRDLEIAGRGLGEVEVDVLWSGERLNIESFRVSDGGLGTVTGSGVLILPELRLELASRLAQVSLPHVLEKAGLPGAWVQLWASGTVRGGGSLAPLKLHFDTELEVDDFAVLDRSFRAPEPAILLRLARASVRAPVDIDPWAVSLAGATVRVGSSELDVEGTLALDELRGLGLRAAGAAFDLAELGPIVGISFAGRGELAATIEGPYGAPTISGTAGLAGFGALGLLLGDARATVVFAGSELSIDRLVARRGSGTIQAHGGLDFTPDGPTLRADATFDTVNLAGLLGPAAVGPTVAQALSGRLYGSLQLRGPLVAPVGRVKLDVRGAQWQTLRLGRARIDAQLGSPDAWLDARAQLDTGGGDVRVSVRYEHDATLALAAEFVDVQLLDVLSDAPWLAGGLSGTLALQGPLGELGGSGRFSSDDLAIGRVQLGRAALSATAHASRLELAGELADGRVQLSGALDLRDALAYAVTARFAQLDIARWVALPEAAKVSLDGSVFSQGRLSEPAGITADAEITAAEVRLQSVVLTATRSLRAAYAAGTIALHDWQLAGPDVQLGLAGEIAVAGELDLRWRLQGDVGLAVGLVPKLEYARGPVLADVRLVGPWAAPELSGAVQVQGATVRLNGVDQPIERLEGTLSLAGRTIDVTSGTAQLGEGTVAFAGELLLPPGAPAQVDLRARFDKVSARPYPEVQLIATGELSLEGPADALSLRGHVNLDSLRYSANPLGLDSLIPQTKLPPLRVPTFQPGEALALRVELRAPSNIIVATGVLEAELRADLLLTGTTEHLGLLGNVAPLWARARYGEHVFTVEQASVDFLGEYELDVQYNLRARTSACGIDIVVEVAGTNAASSGEERWTVTPSGRDARGPVSDLDIYTCLAAGMRLDELAANPSAAAAQATDLLFEVSGLQEQMKRLIPVDEIRLTSGWSPQSHRTTPRLTMRKELGKRLELRYSGSLTEANDYNMRLVYRLTNVATLEGGWDGVDEVSIGDLGLDLRLRWELQ